MRLASGFLALAVTYAELRWGEPTGAQRNSPIPLSALAFVPRWRPEPVMHFLLERRDDFRWLRNIAAVARLDDPSIQHGPEAQQRLARVARRRVDEVVDFG